MANDSPFTTRMSDETREKLEKMIESVGISKKDFIDNMINQYELYLLTENKSFIAPDLKELACITKRINNIYLNISERMEILQNQVKQEYEEQIKSQEKKLDDFVEQIKNLKNLVDEKQMKLNELKMENDNLIVLVNELKGDKDRAIALVKEYELKLKNTNSEATLTLQTRISELENQLIQIELKKDNEILQIQQEYNKKMEDYQSKVIDIIETYKTPSKPAKKSNSSEKVNNKIELENIENTESQE